LFRTDGVRGKANVELTPELAMGLASAYVSVLVDQGISQPQLILGRDTRCSGDMLEAAFVAGACASGANVELAGILPTPGVAYLTRQSGAHGGVMISASHNPIGDNGIKIFSSQGFKIADDIEEAIERRLDEGKLLRPLDTAIGRARPLADAEDRYLDFVLDGAPRLDGVKLCLDTACGAAWRVARRVFETLGAELVMLCDEPDGSRINVGCGSTDVRPLGEAVRAHAAMLGLAFDGDADRCLAVDENGNKVDGDQMMLAFARHQPLQPPILVSTVMSNLGLEMSLRELGVEMRRAQVGDRFVLEEMLRCGAMLGGEQSGHIIFLDRSTTGDGLMTAVRLVAAVRAAGVPLSQLTQMPQVPQMLVNVTTPHKDRLGEDTEITAAIAEVEKALQGRGRLLVRPSGTEPLVRVMAEGPDAAELQRVVSHLVSIIERRLQ
jgi:phosphoglucosamine mutase